MPGIYNVESDVDLTKRLIQGDSFAQEEIYRRYATAIYSMAMHIVGNKETAEDVVQDVFVDIYTKISTLKEPSAFNGWVQKITANRCHMALRSAWFRRRSNTPLEDLELSCEQAVTEQSITVSKAFASLPAKTRLILWMFCVEGFTHSEIAQWLGKSQSYSKSIVNRASKVFERQSEARQRDEVNLPLMNGVQKA